METKIQEDFTLGWKAVSILLGFVLGLLLLAAVISRDRQMWLLFGGMAIVLPIYFRFMRSMGIKDMTARAKTWMLTDDGLVRVYDGPLERETILWSQIQRMRWMRSGGLDFLWDKSNPHQTRLNEEFHEGDLAGLLRGRIRIGEKQADDIAAIWLKHRSTPTPDQPQRRPHPRRAGKVLSRQARHTLLFGTVMGLVFICWAGVDILRQYPSCSWPSAEGKILSQEYNELPRVSRHSPKAQLFLAYQYTVDGRRYLSDRYSLWHPVYVEPVEETRAFARTHATGTVVRVYYDPKRPAKAVLVAGPDWGGDKAFLMLGSFFVLIMLIGRVGMLAEAKKGSRRRSNALVKEYGA
jgi:hypothetical protein